MIRVFFMKDSVRAKDPMSWIKIPKEFKLEDYGPVIAYVDTNSLDDCFMLTNHITHNWTLNPKVTMATEAKVRSSSVGDMFELVDDGYYVVDSTGFKRI